MTRQSLLFGLHRKIVDLMDLVVAFFKQADRFHFPHSQSLFSLAINSLPHNRSQGSGILCTTIVGGAVLLPLFGLLSDIAGFAAAFIVPVLAYIYIAFYGWSRKA